MKKYQLSWALDPNCSDYIRLGSTDPNLIKWFLDELKTIAPNYAFRDDQSGDRRYDLDGNLCQCIVHKLADKDSQIRLWLIQNYSKWAGSLFL